MQEAHEAVARTVVIEGVSPELDCGRYPVKREVGDELSVRADIFREGHDLISAVLLYREQGAGQWSQTPMKRINAGLDLWSGGFLLTENTRYEYTLEAWTDHFETWRSEVGKKVDDGQDVGLELKEGRRLVEETAARSGEERLAVILDRFDRASYGERLDLMFSPEVREVMALYPDRSGATRYPKVLEVVVDRVRARYGAWYEMFPRSGGTEPGRGATFREAEERLPDISRMGFDVVYLPPIHPIGGTHRKGRNNALTAAPGDPGSPYAIGSGEGGHRAVHPELGTLEDFRRFVEAAEEHGMEVALDFAVQCSPDHPYIREHPEWFRFRLDGSIKYAENPPKKYQDIVNVDFYCEAWESLWRELRDVLLFWVEQGVKAFRVDNPHTKPLPFWEWGIREVQSRHPEVIFLSEAFTRPRLLEGLAKLGFTQSYTYFTWRTGKEELTDYLTELMQGPPKEYLRPNFFANTHDILPHVLQTGGRPAFQTRLVLAATLSSTYGIYSGYELGENIPRGEPGTTVYYQDSEVYEHKVRDWDAPGNIKDYVARVNAVRRDNPALHELANLRFYNASDDDVLFYGKATDDGSNAVLVGVNLDPHAAHEAELELPLALFGLGEDEDYVIEALLAGAETAGRGRYRRWLFVPEENPAEVFRLRKA